MTEVARFGCSKCDADVGMHKVRLINPACLQEGGEYSGPLSHLS